MLDQSDNMTETRGSIQQKTTFWSSFKLFLCPCLYERPLSLTTNLTSNTVNLKTKGNNQSNNANRFMFSNSTQLGDKKTPNNRKTVDNGIIVHDKKRQGLLDKKKRSLNIELEVQPNKNIIHNYSICSYVENQLISIGMNQSHLLVKIQKIELYPNQSTVKKDEANSPKRRKEKEPVFNSPQFQKFWNRRYIIFQKFDEGVKLDEGSWSTTPPQQVSQFIASKCNGAKVIIDGFSGVGGTTIKLANVNSCVKIIANDYSNKKLSFLLNNAKVYQVEQNIQISEQDLLSVDKKNIDVIFVNPPYERKELQHSKTLSIVDFQPTLNKVITKCLKLATDILILLPAQINIEGFCSCFNKCASQMKKMTNSCSIKIDKIYFEDQFKYILISFGNIVQKDIKLNDQLEFIYGKLKKKGQTFRHKKVLKKIRQENGMLQLLNILKVTQKRFKQKSQVNKSLDIMDIFYEIVREKQIIPNQKLQKLRQQQNNDSKYRSSLKTISNSKSKSQQKEQNLKAVMEQQKLQQNDINFRQSQRTQSEYSHYSYISEFNKSYNSQRPMRLQSDSFSSVIIKRTLNGSREKRDISPNRGSSPLTPRRIGKHRVSQMPQKKSTIFENSPKRARDL